MDYIVHVIARLYEDADGDASFEPFGELDAATHADVVDALAAIRRFMQYDVMEIVRHNLDQHRSFVEEVQHETAKQGILRDLGSVRTYRTVLTHTLNFCSSIHNYQEHAEVRASRMGGGEHVALVHAMFADAYDRSADLFLMRKLRDAMVHNTLEVVGYRVQARASTVKSPATGGAQTFLSTEELVKVKRVFNQRLRDHLAAYGPEVDLLALMESATAALESLDDELVSLSFPDLSHHARTLEKFVAEVKRLGGDPQESVLLIPCDRLTRLPMNAPRFEAISVRPETTHYALSIVGRRRSARAR